jgi:hypothetical protein
MDFGFSECPEPDSQNQVLFANNKIQTDRWYMPAIPPLRQIVSSGLVCAT